MIELKSEITIIKDKKLKEKLQVEEMMQLNMNPGPIPTTRPQLLAKFASLKILKFIVFEVAQGGGMGLEKWFRSYSFICC